MIRAQLAVVLGPFTAQNAVKTFAARALKKAPEAVTREDVPALLLALRPMLRTLVGSEWAEAFAKRMRVEFRL